MHIGFIESPQATAASHALMRQLRPHLDLAAYLQQVDELRREHRYQLVGLEAEGQLRALAGIRIGQWLHSGRYLEVEDLVTAPDARSQGHGAALLAWIADHARARGCRQLRLVSGVQREHAHRFYLREGLSWEAKYFSMRLDAATA
jgi:GNAT superfamily N-acetyltransferase